MTGTAPAVDIGAPEREALGHVIASLADNKAALGRRYGEWAVSAPTLESAVAAAAMAQDELGHARATYPLLKQLEDGRTQVAGRSGCMALLATELPSWVSFVAVNLVLDGMLSAFVRACEDSAFTGLAQRARKILQEERSHAVHARAWARRLARDDVQRAAFADAVRDAWLQAARWAGPGDDPEFAALTAGGFVDCEPGSLRASVRQMLADTFADTGLATVELPEPADWSGWTRGGAAVNTPACPNCGRSDSVTLVSAFGGQIITAQWHCDACRTHFEAVRDDFDEP